MPVTSFLLVVLRRCRAVLYTGCSGGAPWSWFKTPGPYPSPFWSKPMNPRRLVKAYDASARPIACATHGDLLAGMAAVDSPWTCFSPRFTALRISRSGRGDAFLRAPEGGNHAHHRPASCQGP
jgi:hypothetical protein